MKTNLAVVEEPIAASPGSVDQDRARAPARPTLAEALALADHVSPSPTEARAALQVLRQALADALAVSVDKLQLEAAGTPAGRI